MLWITDPVDKSTPGRRGELGGTGGRFGRPRWRRSVVVPVAPSRGLDDVNQTMSAGESEPLPPRTVKREARSTKHEL